MGYSDGSNGTNGVDRNGTGDLSSAENTVPLIIGGKDIIGSELFPVMNPTSGTEVWKAGGASVQNAVDAAKAAEAAFPAWSRTKPAVRRDLFLRLAEIFKARMKEMASCQKQETGADDGFMNWILNLTVDYLKEVAGKCSMVIGSFPTSSDNGRAALLIKEPYGVVLGIAPW